jgi:uncharacterized membrane protein
MAEIATTRTRMRLAHTCGTVLNTITALAAANSGAKQHNRKCTLQLHNNRCYAVVLSTDARIAACAQTNTRSVDRRFADNKVCHESHTQICDRRAATV